MPAASINNRGLGMLPIGSVGIAMCVSHVRSTLRRCEPLRVLNAPKCFAVNLGTGNGTTVLEVIKAFEAASGRRIAYDIKPRRAGDIDAYFAATNRASELLGWTATRNLEAMCADHWRWQCQNPNGFETT